MSNTVSYYMPKRKKFFDPRTKRFLVWDDAIGWQPEPISSSNVDDLLYMTDYVKAEIQIETAIEAQIAEQVLKNENFFKKELRN